MERPWQPKDLFLVLLLRLPSAPERGPLQAIEMCSLPGLEAGSQVWAALVPSGDSEGQPTPSLLQLLVVLASPGLSLPSSPFYLYLHKGFFSLCLCVPTAFCLAALYLESKNTSP